MIVINNVTHREWRTILSALRCYRRDNTINKFVGENWKQNIDELIKKVERTIGVNDPMDDFKFKMEYDSKWIGE